jgi:hypothetical protein
MRTTFNTGRATYTNAVTGETYRLGFELSNGEPELAKARNLVQQVARIKGWNQYDIKVRTGK